MPGHISQESKAEYLQHDSQYVSMKNIIANAGEVVPANFQLEIEELQSENQMALELGLNVNTFTTKVCSNMSFSTDRQYNRFLVKLPQSYYTMSFDLPTSLGQHFDESVTSEQLETYVQADNPATSIRFGGSSHKWLLVNEAGVEFIECYSTPERKFEGPWVIR